jgi:hypothetical protein
MEYRYRIGRQMAVEFTGCYAVQNSLEPQLGFIAVARNPFDYPIAVLATEGGLSIQHPQRGLKYIGPLQRVSTSEPPHPMSITGSDTTQEHFVVRLNWNLLEEVERLRDGHELVLKAKLQFLCLKLENKSANPGIDAIFWVLAEVQRGQSSHLTFSHREWLDILRNWGYADRRLIEVAIPRMEALKQGFERALKHLEAADKRVWEGHYDDALVAARKCLDSLAPTIRKRLTALDVQGGNQIRYQKLEKFQKAVKELLDIGAHVGVPATRGEALLALTVLKEMLGYFSSEGVFEREGVG